MSEKHNIQFIYSLGTRNPIGIENKTTGKITILDKEGAKRCARNIEHIKSIFFGEKHD